ncbi:MAG: hypothetical protein OXT65_00830 [Alphaproteobacteria bacterium]|nr:hypothetical protein [Alphaproteobacteria bacterium]
MTQHALKVEGREDTSRRCEAIGNIITCLFYLSQEANRSDLKGIATALEQTIGATVSAGRQELATHLDNMAQNNACDNSAFLDSFCKVTDGDMMLELKEILLKQNGAMHNTLE